MGFPIGSYTCRVRANDTDVIQSKSVLIKLTLPLPTAPSPNPVQCSVSSLGTSLQIRVFDTDCLSWSEDTKRDINTNFSNTLKGVIRAECSDCNIERDNIELVVDPLTCSIDRTAVFRGVLSTQDPTLRKELYCVLDRWQQSGSLIQIDNQYHRVLTLPMTSASTPTIVGSVVGILSFLIIVFTATSVVVGYMISKKTTFRNRQTNSVSILPGYDSNQRQSQVENILT